MNLHDTLSHKNTFSLIATWKLNLIQEMNYENYKVFVLSVQMGGLLGFHTV